MEVTASMKTSDAPNQYQQRLSMHEISSNPMCLELWHKHYRTTRDRKFDIINVIHNEVQSPLEWGTFCCFLNIHLMNYLTTSTFKPFFYMISHLVLANLHIAHEPLQEPLRPLPSK